MCGRLTTHVLDTARGRPAAGLRIDLWRIRDGERKHIGSFITDSDGRVPEPLMEGAAFEAGIYELVFHAGDYQADLGRAASVPRFFDDVPVRFGLTAGEHFHVPLLLSPFGYSTYRGS